MLNPENPNLVRFRPHSGCLNTTFNVYVDGRIVHETHSIKYLGITLQGNLSWDMHIQDVKSKVAPALGILYKLRYKLNEKTKLMIYNCLINSHFNYMSIVYAYNRNSSSLKSLQRLQNKALKIVHNLPATFSTISLFKEICKRILPIYGLYEYNILKFVFKSIHRIGHTTIHFSQNQASFNTRNRENLRIDYVGGIAYNNLPVILKSINRISIFKTSCKEHLLDNIETLL